MDKTAVFFRVVPKQPESHLFEVTCTVPDPDPLGQRFSLPAWTPGSYLIRDYSRHVVALSAESEAGPLEVEKIDKDTWLCAACAGSLSVRYEVYAGELSVRTSHLDTTHGYFNGTCLFLRAHGAEERPCRVELVRPEGNRYRNWRVATALREVGAKRYGFGMYRAESYDELIDHPVEMGDFEVIAFDACGVPHEMVLSGRHSAHLPRLRKDLKILCEHHIRFFGEPAPVERYVFLVTVVGEGYGGLEHSASCSLICGRNDLPVPHDTNLTDGYRRFLGLCSHEYFHLWNVKRIKPAAFTPYNLNREVHTRLLWVFEGITSYYDDLALVRSGLINAESYLDLLGKTATRVRRVPGRFRQTLAESSFDAWTRFYKQDENAPNALVSYYAKGALVALALDLTIRRETKNVKSLDDVMHALWKQWRETGIGLGEDGFETMAEATAGCDLKTFFEKAVRGTEDLPLGSLLAEFGIEFHLRSRLSETDMGGTYDGKAPSAEQVTLGADVEGAGDEVRLRHVLEAGPASAAGLAPGDVMLAVDGLRVTRSNLEKHLMNYAPDSSVEVHAFRRDELMAFDVQLKAAPLDTCEFVLVEHVDQATRARRETWLNGK